MGRDQLTNGSTEPDSNDAWGYSLRPENSGPVDFKP